MWLALSVGICSFTLLLNNIESNSNVIQRKKRNSVSLTTYWNMNSQKKKKICWIRCAVWYSYNKCGWNIENRYSKVKRHNQSSNKMWENLSLKHICTVIHHNFIDWCIGFGCFIYEWRDVLFLSPFVAKIPVIRT